MQFPQSTFAICWSLFFSVSNNTYVSGVSTNFHLIYLYLYYIILLDLLEILPYYTHIVVPSIANVVPARSAMKSTQCLARLEERCHADISLGPAEWAF